MNQQEINNIKSNPKAPWNQPFQLTPDKITKSKKKGAWFQRPIKTASSKRFPK